MTRIHFERSPRWVRAAFAVVALGYFVACFHGIANYWQWGHNGFNGAAFTQAARNTLRFGVIAEAQYHTAATPPPPESLYTHHPLLLHFHLVPLLALLGDAEWVPRLVPALYSFGSLLLLFVFTRRHYGPVVALVSAAAYATIPLGLVFANMIDHEQGAIFFCLLFLHAYARFIEAPSFRWALGALLAISCAVQFDWPAYYLALFVAIHVFYTGVRRQARLFEIRPEYVFALGLSVVVLANFAAFYAFIVHVRGTFAEMLHSAEQRSASPTGYWPHVAKHALDLQGPLYLGLLVAFLARFTTRLVRGEAHLGDLVPVFFTGMQAVHSIVFKEAGFIHAYWTYYLNPALGVAAGCMLVGIARSARSVISTVSRAVASLFPGDAARKSERPLTVLATAVAVAIVALPIATQARDGASKLHESLTSGFGAYVDGYDDQFWLVEWAKDVARRYPRDVRDALIAPGFDYRIEWLYYVDAPRRDVGVLTSLAAIPASGPERHRLLFVDLGRSSTPLGLPALLAAHRAYLYSGRFLTVDLDDSHAELVSLEPILGKTPIWYRWLVHPTHPRVLGWRTAEADPTVLLTIANGVVPTGARTFGADTGGSESHFDCPDGFAIDAVETTDARWLHGPTWSAIRARCRRFVGRTETRRPFGPWLGVRGTGALRRIACPEGAVVVGVSVDTNPYPHGIRLTCEPIDELARAPSRRVEPQADENTYVCPVSSAAGGLRGKFGLLTDRVGISCVAADSGFLDVARSLRPRGSVLPAEPSSPSVVVPSPLDRH